MEFKCVKFERSSGNVVYIGKHWKTNPLTSDSHWSICKLTYDEEGVVKKQYSEGKWDDRASLNWL